MFGTNSPRDTYMRETPVDTKSERFLLWFVKRRWQKNRGRSGEIDLFGPFDGWGQFTPPTIRNTRTRRSLDPGFPAIVGFPAGILTLLILLLATVSGVTIFWLFAAVPGAVAAWAIHAHNCRKSPDHKSKLADYTIKRKVSVALYYGGALQHTPLDPRRAELVPGITAAPLDSIMDTKAAAFTAQNPAGVHGAVLEIPTPAGATTDEMHSATERMKSALGYPVVVNQPSAHFSTTRLVMLDIDAMAKGFQLAQPDVQWVYDHQDERGIIIGHDELGSLITLAFNGVDNNHFLVSGASGSGKSAFLMSLFIQAAIAQMCVYAVDFKSAASLRPLAAAGIADGLASGPVDGTQLVHQIALIADARNAAGWMPTPDSPPILLVIDELNDIQGWSDLSLKEQFEIDLGNLMRKGRSAGIAVIGAGQQFERKTLPTSMRNQFNHRLLLRTPATGWEMGLGAGYSDDAASRIKEVFAGDPRDSRNRGVGFYSDGSAPVAVKTRYVDTQGEVMLGSNLVSTSWSDRVNMLADTGFLTIPTPDNPHRARFCSAELSEDGTWVVDPTAWVDGHSPQWLNVGTGEKRKGLGHVASAPVAATPAPISVDDLD